jgi:hypothetical protein
MALDPAALDVRTTLILNAVFALVVASLYTFVGRRLSQRQVSPESQLAATMFSVWWFSLGAITLVTAAMSLMGAAGVDDLAVYITVTHLAIIILCVALAGLLYYLAFLFTGKRGVMGPIVVFYVLYYVFLVAFVTYSGPDRVEVKRWGTTLHYADPIGGPVLIVLLLATLLPIIAGALAYFSLLFRVRDRSQRYRIALVAGTLLAWFMSSLLSSFTGINQAEWWQFVSRLIGAAAALLILWAFDPPRWVQHLLGVRSVVAEASGGR